MMNREQRRAYAAKIKNDKRASECPLCHTKALFYTEPQLLPYEGEKEKFTKDDFKVVVKCEACRQVVLDSPAVTKLIQPGVYLPLPIDVFITALKYEEEHPEEEKTEEVQDGEFVEVASSED